MTGVMPDDPFTVAGSVRRHAIYTALAEAGPVHRLRFPSGVDGWLVTGYDAARAALTDPNLVKSRGGPVGYLRELLGRKRREPADDLLSALLAVRDGTDALTEDELTSMVFLLLVAGHETTVNLIGNGVQALLEHPDQLARLRARLTTQPDRIGAAVEELLRFDGPLQSAIPLVTAAPTEVAGTGIPAGEVVVVSLLAANRDPHRGPDAGRLDITRPEVPHLAFGHGIHHCLGAPLARLEGRIALGTLLARFPDLRLAVPAAELDRAPSLLMNGLTELPVLLR